MLKQVTVNVVVDDHEPEKCSLDCEFYDDEYCTHFNDYCGLQLRCKQCLEEAK